MTVDIILAAYNGEKYIKEQINSILDQSYENFHLYIRDDASTDGTLSAVNEAADDKRVTVIKRQINSGNAKVAFFDLIRQTTADVVFFSDQDDIWDKDKLKDMLSLFEGIKTPLMVFSDCSVINEAGELVHPSMNKRQHISPKRTALNHLLVQNCVTGCTAAVNRALINILKEPENIPVHDWWIACVCAIFGELKYLDKSTVLYREHQSNLCGPKDMNSPKYIIGRLKDKEKSKNMLELSYTLAKELLADYPDIPISQKKMLKEFAESKNSSKPKKLSVIHKYHIYKYGIIRKLGQLIFI